MKTVHKIIFYSIELSFYCFSELHFMFKSFEYENLVFFFFEAMNVYDAIRLCLRINFSRLLLLLHVDS